MIKNVEYTSVKINIGKRFKFKATFKEIDEALNTNELVNAYKSSALSNESKREILIRQMEKYMKHVMGVKDLQEEHTEAELMSIVNHGINYYMNTYHYWIIFGIVFRTLGRHIITLKNCVRMWIASGINIIALNTYGNNVSDSFKELLILFNIFLLSFYFILLIRCIIEELQGDRK